ncbi:MAG: copper chaperone PCu(A)C [Gammaproteobacteria bacterium]|nr:copper chaperone PCu(A)C [Gammaproteobacteria bacterium]
MYPSLPTVFAVFGAVLAFLSMSTTALAEAVADRITVNDPYIRAVPPVVKTSAAFMQMQNNGDAEYFLVDASTPAAGAVELHMHTNDDGVMRMRRIPHIHLPPGKTVSLQPGGLHIMLFDLKAPLNEGIGIPILLTFDDGSQQQITAKVRSVQHGMKGQH